VRPIPDRAVTFVGQLEGCVLTHEQSMTVKRRCGTVFPMETEIWRPVEENPHYEVSNLGRVRSIQRQMHNYVKRGSVLRGRMRRKASGRPACMIVQIGRGNYRRVHRLVLIAFVGPAPEGCEGCHNDGDPANNRLSNLRWDTHAANMADQIDHGTKSPPPTHWGEDHPNARLTVDAVHKIRAAPLRDGVLGELSAAHGVSTKTIWRIRHGKAWAHV
jgi:hypothetical protein